MTALTHCPSRLFVLKENKWLKISQSSINLLLFIQTKLFIKTIKISTHKNEIDNNLFSRVSGSIFSKDSSLIHLVVNAINSSRNALEKPTVVLVLPAVQFLCVAMAFGGQLIRAIGEGVSFEVNKLKLSYLLWFLHFLNLSLQSIHKVIERINQFKSKQSYSVRRHVQAKNKQENQEQIVNKEEDVRTTRGDCLDGETFYDCRETFEDCSRKSSDNFALKIASLGCVFLVYLQFSFLVCLVGYTQMKAGFVFLLVCAFCISSLVLKVRIDCNLKVKTWWGFIKLFIKINDFHNKAWTLLMTNKLRFAFMINASLWITREKRQ